MTSPITDAELDTLNAYVAKVSHGGYVTLTPLEYNSIVSRINEERARRERAEVVLKQLDELDWIVGYEIGESNSLILDAALDAAREHLASTGGTR